jgi:proteasome lid subunit RPN8/RPN11
MDPVMSATESPSAGALPLAIEYSEAAIEKIRGQVWDGFRRFSRGGLEVGGILYGSREDRTLDIQDIQPISCQHAFGPGFVLSESDREALEEQMRRDSEDARFQNMVRLGWFFSHTRSGLALSPADLEIYSKFFPEPWQITLVVCPERDGSTRGGFFVRAPDGSVLAEKSDREFSFPVRNLNVPRRREGSRQEKSAETASEPTVPAMDSTAQRALAEPAAEVTPFLLAGVETAQSPQRRIKWKWLAAWSFLLIGLALLAMRWVSADRSPEPISLSLIERDGQLQIEWDRAALPVTKAVHGSLEILEGSGTKKIALTPQDLAAGTLTYERKSGDVEVRMTVEDAGGRTVEEASRFLGSPPAQKAGAGELDALTEQREGLEAEIKRLRGENAAQSERIKQLETMLRSLEERLGVK